MICDFVNNYIILYNNIIVTNDYYSSDRGAGVSFRRNLAARNVVVVEKGKEMKIRPKTEQRTNVILIIKIIIIKWMIIIVFVIVVIIMR